VSIVVRVLDVQKISEMTGELNAVVEYTSRWSDSRLAFDAVSAGHQHLDLFGPPAVTKLNGIWNPGLTLQNLVGTPRSVTHGLTIYADGTVVAVDTVDGTFKVDTTMDSFPFDTQRLALTFITPNYDRSQVTLRQTDADRMQTSVADHPTATQWHLKPLSTDTTNVVGWNGQTYSRFRFWLPASREASQYVLRIFAPFLVIMLGSVIVLWSTESSALGKGSMILSGIVALVALSFTFESSFPGSISMNSPISALVSIGFVYMMSCFFLNLTVLNHEMAWAKRDSFLFHSVRTVVRFGMPAILLSICVTILVAAAV